jgi:peptide/nickel transport system permease protein
MVEQYFVWAGKALTGDLGTSLWTGKPVLDEIGANIGVTLQLLVMSLVLGAGLAVPAGCVMAYVARRLGRHRAARRHHRRHHGAELLAGHRDDPGAGDAGAGLPQPRPRAVQPGSHRQPAAHAAAVAGPRPADPRRRRRGWCAARCSMRSARTTSARRAPRASASASSSTSTRCATRCSPSSPSVGITAGYLFGGAIVVEQVFALPGLGRLIIGAIGERNYPLIQAAILLVTIGFVAINFLVDLLYAAIDPRVRS